MWGKLAGLIGKKALGMQSKSADSAFSKAAKMKIIAGVLGTLVPIVGYFAAAIFVVAIIMSTFANLMDGIAETTGHVLNFFDTTENFLTFQGWRDSSQSYLNNVQKEYEFYKEQDGLGELDVPLIHATLHYGKILNPDIFTDEIDLGEEPGEGSMPWDASWDTVIKEQETLRFYEWANGRLGSTGAIAIDLNALMPMLVSYKVINSCVCDQERNVILDRFNDIFNFTVGQASRTLKEVFTHGARLRVDLIQRDFPMLWENNNPFRKINATAIQAEYLRKNGEDIFKTLFNIDDYNENLNCQSNVICPIYSEADEGEEPVIIDYYAQAEKAKFRPFNDYEKYKEYLRRVFVPEYYINCTNCVFKDSSEEEKEKQIELIIDEIFDQKNMFYDLIDRKSTNANEGGSWGGDNFDTPVWDGNLEYTSVGTVNFSGQYEGHRGIDMTTSSEPPFVLAVEAGTVMWTESYNVNHSPGDSFCKSKINGVRNPGYGGNKTWGNNIVIKGTSYCYRYAHLSNFVVTSGEVQRGQPIGIVGNTGCSTGPHLHLEVLQVDCSTLLSPYVLSETTLRSALDPRIGRE